MSDGPAPCVPSSLIRVNREPIAIPAARIIMLQERIADESVSRDELSRELSEILELVYEYAPRDEASRLASSGGWSELLTPEFIDHAIQVSQVLGSALVSSWVARADNRVTQTILRRRQRGRRATASQARSFAIYQLNLVWEAGIRTSDEAKSESVGPDGWSFTWLKDGIEYTASGDHNLDRITLAKTVIMRENEK